MQRSGVPPRKRGSKLAGLNDPRQASHVGERRAGNEPGPAGDDPLGRCSRGGADFHQQPSALCQPALGRLDEPLNDLDTRRPRHESALRFVVTDIAGQPGELEWLATADVVEAD